MTSPLSLFLHILSSDTSDDFRDFQVDGEDVLDKLCDDLVLIFLVVSLNELRRHDILLL